MYSVVKDSDMRWNVREMSTSQDVYSSPTEKSARDMVRSLNLGAGFNGYTPGFMTIEYLPLKQKEKPSNE